MTPFAVTPFRSSDRDAWERLARAYHAFYEESYSRDVYERIWTRLHEDQEIHGLGAYDGDRLVGIVHYLFHGHVWQAGVCYLQDLFVDGSARGRGAGGALIAQVEREALRRGAFRVYWMTRQDNETARRLYDRVAAHSGFIRYELRV